MLRIGADDTHHTFAVDHLAFITHLFDGRSNFHFNLPAGKIARATATEQFFHGRDRAAITPPAPDRLAEL
jgi:hypothetical protein